MICIDEIVTGLFNDRQIVFAGQLTELAEGFQQRVHRTPLVFDEDAG